MTGAPQNSGLLATNSARHAISSWRSRAASRLREGRLRSTLSRPTRRWRPTNIKRHKTWNPKGTLSKPLPPSVRAILESSLKNLPRPTLFVSELTRQPFNSEATFLTWACRAFHAVFGRHVTTNGARHAFASALDTSRVSSRALEQLATEMGHSRAAQRAYLRLSQSPESIRTAAGELSPPLLTTAGHDQVGQVGLAST